MPKLFLTLLLSVLIFQFTNAQKRSRRLFDQDVIIQQCNISTTVKGIIATTWIELEFYNNKEKEVEGKYTFTLNPGQSITGFQLMLGDKYRDGSVEERWKARFAYNSIVGKRMDPALLQLTGNNHYSLNIYPFTAKGARKVKIKIEEVLNFNATGYHYNLDFLKDDSIGKLNINAVIYGYPKAPLINKGLFKKSSFTYSENNYSINTYFTNIVNPDDIDFILPVSSKPTGFINPLWGDFFAKQITNIPDSLTIDVKKLKVYWDCSASMHDTDKINFIKYLKLVIAKYHPEQLTIVPFNHQLISEKTFTQQDIINYSWQPFIENIPNYGATQFGTLNLHTNDDLILVFTDGKQTWGRKYSEDIETPVIFITTGYWYDYSFYNNDYSDYYDYSNYMRPAKLTAIKTYGLYNSYYNQNAMAHINVLASFKTKLISVEDEFGNKVDISNTLQVYTQTLLSGKLKPGSAKLILKYGINDKALVKQEINFQPTDSITDFNRAKALIQAEEIMKNNYWYNTLSFGIDNKILTSQTAFIVLEKVEDYVNYNITPPDDLLQECMAKGFVKHNYKQTYQQIKKADEIDILKLVSTEYNKRIVLWGDSTNKINLNTIAKDYLDIQENNKKEDQNNSPQNSSSTSGNTSKQFNSPSNLDEVVVVGYQTLKKTDVTTAIASTGSKDLKDIPINNVAEALNGRLAGVTATVTEGSPDADVVIRIRGGSSITQDNSPLYIIDGVQVESGLNSLSLQDIQSVDVLKDAAATAIYGARGANGVVIITTKSGRYYYNNYNSNIVLAKREDISYMKKIKNTTKENKYAKYLALECSHKQNMGFYTDMAFHFYEQGLTEYIDGILMKAAELSNNNFQSQLLIAFIYEYMKQYDKAITIYENLNIDYPANIDLIRNLGWAYYQNKEYDSAVSTLYKGITSTVNSTYNDIIELKDIMLADMNMIIAIHAKELHIDYIPKEIIKPVEADMRVIIESPASDLYSLSVKQPRKDAVNSSYNINRDGQRLQIASNNYSIAEFTIKKANTNKYSFNISAYGNNYNGVPAIIRIIKIKDFGKSTQSIDVDIMNVDNQYGDVEFETIKVK